MVSFGNIRRPGTSLQCVPVFVFRLLVVRWWPRTNRRYELGNERAGGLIRMTSGSGPQIILLDLTTLL